VIDGDASTHVPVYPSRLSKRFSRLMRRKGLTSIGSKDAQTDTTAPLIYALDGTGCRGQRGVESRSVP